MADSRFHPKSDPVAIGKLLALVGMDVPDGIDPERMVHDVAPIETATADDITFLDNRKYIKALADCGAGFCITTPDLAERVPADTIALAAPHPYLVFATLAGVFYAPKPARAGVHDRAAVDDTAKLGDGVEVRAGAVIAAGADIGDGCVIGANVSVAENVVVGAGCRIGANVSLENCVLGERVDVQAGVVIGAPGFGFAPHPERHVPVPQVGRVMVGDDCHIGANSSLACGSGHDTVIGRNVWIDNLVQIAHNVRIGDGSVVVAQVGIAGSTKVGNFAQIGGQVGIAGHLNIGDGVRIGATSAVMRDVPSGETVLGSPAIDAKEFWRHQAALKRLLSKKRSTK